MRISLANYRVLQEFTTYWCPEREEHGYFLAPVYRCRFVSVLDSLSLINSYDVARTPVWQQRIAGALLMLWLGSINP